MNHTKQQVKSSTRNTEGRRAFSRFKPKGRFSRKKVARTLDPDTLIRNSTGEAGKTFVPGRRFQQMPIDPRIAANLDRMGFDKPTEIQEKTIDPLANGRDLVGIAKTGTGKTAAFLIPIIEQILNHDRSTRALVVVPTRELAIQVSAEFKRLSQGLNLGAAVFIGGTSVGGDLKQLRAQNHVIIGTPGRLLDLYNRRALPLKDVPILVLDEFDRMLDMGFVNDIKKITNGMVSRRQTMLFSATLDRSQEMLINEMLHDPVEVKVSAGTHASDQIQQDLIRVGRGQDKFELLLKLISDQEFEKVLLFAETKRSVDRISKRLIQSGVKTALMHGDKSQNYRNSSLDKFKKGRVQVLVATDVAARGIDVFNVTHVINYQLPKNLESYVHRIGRTGRAGKVGKAFTFVD